MTRRIALALIALIILALAAAVIELARPAPRAPVDELVERIDTLTDRIRALPTDPQ